MFQNIHKHSEELRAKHLVAPSSKDWYPDEILFKAIPTPLPPPYALSANSCLTVKYDTWNGAVMVALCL